VVKSGDMKTLANLLILGVAALLPFTADAQTEVAGSKTKMKSGTLVEFSPEKMVVNVNTSSQPLVFAAPQGVTFVDEAGNAVPVEAIKPNLSVTVTYTKDGEKLTASKVVVEKPKS